MVVTDAKTAVVFSCILAAPNLDFSKCLRSSLSTFVNGVRSSFYERAGFVLPPQRNAQLFRATMEHSTKAAVSATPGLVC